MARLYTDENVPLPVVVELRRFGHDVLTSVEAGNAGRAVPDEEVGAFAAADRRILLTLNRRHFVRLHQVTPDHTGILVCTFDPDFAGQSAHINHLLVSRNDWASQLLRINRPG